MSSAASADALAESLTMEEDQFNHCSFCGLSAEDDDDDDFYSSAFVASASNRKQNLIPTAKEITPAREIYLKKCTRCKSVAYCSRACQRKDYYRHKRACRAIGEALKNRDSGNAPEKEEVVDAITGSKNQNRPETPQVTASQPKIQPAKFNPIPIKGVPAPTCHPRTSVVEQVDPAELYGFVVVHCDSVMSPAYCFSGVYVPASFRGRCKQLIRCPWQTDDLFRKLGSNHRHLLTKRGFCLDFDGNDEMHRLSEQYNNKMGSVWSLTSEDLGIHFVQCSQPRSRDKQFWHDPCSLSFLDASDVYSPWVLDDSHTIKPVLANIAMTPLEVIHELIELNFSIPRNIPAKYKTASDFHIWNRNFVLHADPRSCQIPLSWVDSYMGLYKPVEGMVLNGYPVWRRHCEQTKELIGSIVDSVMQNLASRGIRLGDPGNSTCQLYVGKRSGISPSLLSLSKTSGHIDKFAKGEISASHIPKNMADLLTAQASLYTAPDEAFSTWEAQFEGQWVDLHISFTPEGSFMEAIRLSELMQNKGNEDGGQERKTKKKKKKKKKPVETGGNGFGATQARETIENTGTNAAECSASIHSNSSNEKTDNLSGEDIPTSVPKDEVQPEVVTKPVAADHALRHLALLVETDASNVSSLPHVVIECDWTLDETFEFLFKSSGFLWLSISDSVTSPILEAALTKSTPNWASENASKLMVLFSSNNRYSDLTVLLNAGVCVTAKDVAAVFSNFPQARGDQISNKMANILCTKCTISMESDNDFGLVAKAISNRVGKRNKKDIIDALKRASDEMQKLKKMREREKKNVTSVPCDDPPEEESTKCAEEGSGVDDNPTEMMSPKHYDFEGAKKRITAALVWYDALYADLLKRASERIRVGIEEGFMLEETTSRDEPSFVRSMENSKTVLTTDEVAEALLRCKNEDALDIVETSIDIFQWDAMSEWVVDITEQAHKWFRRHIKKDRHLCERVIRRLTLLSTGRWPYVLCKRLKSNKSSCALYETKIDTGSRIIWEVAVSFSPRRSCADQNYCEQVIRVWDIVLDHDNLSRVIEQTIDRIEKSHLRGEQCALYAEIDTSMNQSAKPLEGVRIPRVFPMQQELSVLGSSEQRPPDGKSRFFHPASSDPKQFTLLKFYELNAGAIKILLDDDEEKSDLPFTPGPKEHEIIHYQTNPQRSILLMGRSGTGKTTCLVFRMFAQYASYIDDTKEHKPRQLFLTKNDVLCREVERSFNNMGLAWRKRSVGADSNSNNSKPNSLNGPKFLTSSEWLDILDVELPGDHFFSPCELEKRIEGRKDNDTITKGIEAWLTEETSNEKKSTAYRQEMTFQIFRKLWRKIRSGSRSQLDSVLVWREIKSFIKGSVAALHISDAERSQNRFLSLKEYLAIPRKQSRMEEAQRIEVYSLFCKYEKLKKELGYFDECDLVYNIAGRISLLDRKNLTDLGLLPVDALYVDECQDFTQAELFVLAQICSDPNSLFLAGDTAQSIALGVDFRFTDVRQIFFNHFGGTEPKLLQLTHNYRSHSGVLRLAASVVELLYFFFSSSLDRLPPDLGLFSGPKPVIMEISSAAELVLMLEGSKRETSRIEFGAHQVVIVRSEDAKNNLPDEFGVDKDWVMTVQESKGLEFDDVLLYNFFSDSPADDCWRVVKNYSEADIKEYYSDAIVAASGVQNYDWENPLLRDTRHLDFSCDQHKILETELKMLYTAITRARVNVFIAETNVEQSRPMFNYFQRRCVVDVVNKNSSEGLAGVRVFGCANTVEDWRKRGEYYLQNAEGDRQKGCLRLAAKCFEKAGEFKRRDFALAFLSFAELEERESTKNRGKQSAEYKERLFGIGEQLLEARDMGFLNKAALCLLRTGLHDEQAAQMFELYGRLSYAKRICDEKGTPTLPFPPSSQEKNYFSYAGKLFAKCSQRSMTGGFACDSFRNYVCAGMYTDATKLLSSGLLPPKEGKTFQVLSQMCKESPDSELDPIAHFRRDFNQSEICKPLAEAVKRFGNIGCRTLLKSNDSAGFSAALSLLPSTHDRIQLLTNIESSAEALISRKPWASHTLFAVKMPSESEKRSVDITEMLVTELEADQRQDEAVDILEDRGYFLEAARLLSKGGGQSLQNLAREFNLRVKYVELVLLSDIKIDDREPLKSMLQPHHLLKSELLDSVKCSSTISKCLLEEDFSHLFKIIPDLRSSIMWQHRALKLALDKSPVEVLFNLLPGSCVSDRLKFIHDLALNLKCLAAVLRSPNLQNVEDSNLISHAERYFDVVPQKYDPTTLTTNPVANLRLREALLFEQCALPLSSSGHSLQHGLAQVLDRDGVHSMLSNFVYSQAAHTLLKLNELIEVREKQTRPCLNHLRQGRCSNGSDCCFRHSLSFFDVQEYVELLELHIICVKDMRLLHLIGPNGISSLREPWTSLREKMTSSQNLALNHLLSIIFNATSISFANESLSKTDTTLSNYTLVLKESTTNALEKLATHRYCKLSLDQKKEVIKESINYWRILSLCKSTSRASQVLHDSLATIETEKSIQYDLMKGRRHYFINKFSRNIFPRLWLWAVDSMQDDIFNTISVIDRIIKTSLRKGLASIDKFDQVSLLELTHFVLFGALSLRYSEEVQLPLLMTQSTLRSVTSHDCIHGFGSPLPEPLLTYCDKCFDRVFVKVVALIEKTVALILSNKLLSVEDENRFERAFVLTSCICCNAIVFSSQGLDMNVREHKRDLASFPSLPLQGSIKQLVAELRKTLQSKNLPPNFDNLFQDTPSNFLHLANSTAQLHNDDIVLCELSRSSYDVKMHSYVRNHEYDCLLERIPFHESCEIFSNKESKSFSFLESFGTLDPSHEEADEAEQGRRSEELNASRLIVRFIEYGKVSREKVESALKHFRWWKRVLQRFFLKLKSKVEQIQSKVEERLQINDECVSNCFDEGLIQKIPSPLSNPTLFHQRKDYFLQFFDNAVVDSVECELCGCCFDQKVAKKRRQLCMQTEIPFHQFAKNFNSKQFGSVKGDFKIFLQHSQNAVHQDIHMSYTKQLDNFATVFARLILSQEFLGQLIHLCDEEGQKGHASSAWYLHTAEEARDLLQNVTNTVNAIGSAGFTWTRGSKGSALNMSQTAHSLPEHVEAFVSKKKLEEGDFRKTSNSEEDAQPLAHEDEESGKAISDLLLGPYLNPEAPSFIPQSGF